MFVTRSDEMEITVITNIESILPIGSQQRLLDYSTGISFRIHPDTKQKTFSMELEGEQASMTGFLANAYRISERKLNREIIKNVRNIGNLSIQEVNELIENGLLNTLVRRNPKLADVDGFEFVLKMEDAIKTIESKHITYDETLERVEEALKQDSINEKDKEVLENLKKLYKNPIFKDTHEIFYQKLAREKREHSAEEISEDLKEIGRSSLKEDTLKEFVADKEKEYNVLGNRMSEEQIIEGINEDNIYYYDIIEVIRTNSAIRNLVQKKILTSENNKEKIEYKELLEEISEINKADKERD